MRPSGAMTLHSKLKVCPTIGASLVTTVMVGSSMSAAREKWIFACY